MQVLFSGSPTIRNTNSTQRFSGQANGPASRSKQAKSPTKTSTQVPGLKIDPALVKKLENHFRKYPKSTFYSAPGFENVGDQFGFFSDFTHIYRANHGNLKYQMFLLIGRLTGIPDGILTGNYGVSDLLAQFGISVDKKDHSNANRIDHLGDPHTEIYLEDGQPISQSEIKKIKYLLITYPDGGKEDTDQWTEYFITQNGQLILVAPSKDWSVDDKTGNVTYRNVRRPNAQDLEEVEKRLRA